MALYKSFTYSSHAVQRMRRRRVSRHEVEITLLHGEGYEEEDGTWVFELGQVRVVIAERDTVAHVVTVIRLRKHT